MSRLLTQRRIAATTFVALDLEATGAAPGHDRIIEVGAARFRMTREGRVIPGETYHQLVSPERRIPAPIKELTGIDDATLDGAPTLGRVWDDMWSFLRWSADDEPPVLLAHKASSDLTFLAAAANRMDLPLGEPMFVCTLNISRTVFTDAPSHRLGELVRWLRCTPSDQRFHRALPDALHTRNLFGRAVSHQGARTLGELGVREAEPHPPPDTFEIRIPDRLAPAVEALELGKSLTVIYRGGSKGKKPRPVTPMAFYNHAGYLWMRGFCHLDGEAKSFRCDKLRLPEAA